MKTLRLFALLLTACLPLCSCISEEDEGAETADIVRVGDPLPAFSVQTHTGAHVSPATLAGRPAVIVFFSTTCPDCRRALPAVQQVYDACKAVAAFVCIGREEAAETVAAFWRDNGLTMPYSPQPDRSVYALFARQTIPRVYVAGADGRVRNVFVEELNAPMLQEAIRHAAESDP